MMRILRHILCGLAVVLVFPTLGVAQDNPATPKPALTWIWIDWQPAWIKDGPLAGTGYAQTVERMLRERMPQYEHQARSVSNVRIYSALKNRDSCFAASHYKGIDLQEEKRKGIIWSAPAYIFFYHGIIARPDAVERIKQHEKDGYINFNSLIKDETLTGSFQPGRSYSRWLNPIFEDDSKTGNLFKWAGEARLTQSMFKLMDAGRIDYFVDYVIMLKYHQASTGTPSEYEYLPIREHKELLGLGSIACSDTPLGHKVIKDINAVLEKIRPMEEVRDVNRRWLMPESQEEEYWHKWETELLPIKE